MHRKELKKLLLSEKAPKRSIMNFNWKLKFCKAFPGDEGSAQCLTQTEINVQRQASLSPPFPSSSSP